MIRRIVIISICLIIMLNSYCFAATAISESKPASKTLLSDEYLLLSEAELPITDINDVAIGQEFVLVVYHLNSSSSIYSVYSINGDYVYAYRTSPQVSGPRCYIDDEGNAIVLQTRTKEVNAYILHNPSGLQGAGIDCIWPNELEVARIRNLASRNEIFTVYSMDYDRLILIDVYGGKRVIFDHARQYIDLFGSTGPLFRQWHLGLIAGYLLFVVLTTWFVCKSRKYNGAKYRYMNSMAPDPFQTSAVQERNDHS